MSKAAPRSDLYETVASLTKGEVATVTTEQTTRELLVEDGLVDVKEDPFYADGSITVFQGSEKEYMLFIPADNSNEPPRLSYPGISHKGERVTDITSHGDEIQILSDTTVAELGIPAR